MTIRITHLIEEQKKRSKLFNKKDLDIEVARTQDEPQILKYLFQIKKKYHPRILGNNLNSAK
jgi:hypothetical protein